MKTSRLLLPRIKTLCLNNCLNIWTHTNKLQSIFRKYTRMSSIYVKSLKDDDRVQINLDLQVGDVLKTFNLNRLKSEELGHALERLRANLEKKSKKKTKKKKSKQETSHQEEEGQEDSPIPLEVLHNGETIPCTVCNEQAWIDGAVLRVGEEKIPVIYNAPSVKIDSLCPTLMVGYPLFPDVEYELCNFQSCEFYWKSIEKKHVDKIKRDASNGLFDLMDASMTNTYIPKRGDLDKHILLVCVPTFGEKVGKTQAVVSQSAVMPGPGICPFEKRHKFTAEKTKPNEFRVVSYNILAKIYTNTEWAKSHLFVHCPEYAIEMSYRKQLLLKEIEGYQADIVCLQEVDKSVFNRHLMPGLNLLGYEGTFRPKKGGVSEGCATFVRKEKFKVVNYLDITLSDYLSTDESCKDLWDKVCEVPALKEKLEQRSSVLQVTILECVDKPGRFVCSANTHLFYHPNACNIRLIHAMTALRYLQAICAAYTGEGKEISMVFCGDFNSSPDVGVYQLMTSQFIQKDHIDWLSAGEEEALKDVELSHSMNIVSGCGTPEFTHYGAPIQCTLDYVFVESTHLDVVSSVPLPELADVTTHTFLPNPLIPSDHLAIICDLRFKS